MKKITLFLTIVCFTKLLWAQVDTAGVKLDADVKNKLIYTVILDEVRTETFVSPNGSTKAKKFRVIDISFKQGITGDFNTMEKNGGNLLQALQSDQEAADELKTAISYRKKARLSKSLTVVSAAGALGLTAAFFLRYSFEKTFAQASGLEPKPSPLTIALGAGALAGFGGVIYFPIHEKKMLDKFVASTRKSVEIYNQHILKEADN
ncbi:MAG: hypothetical protein K0R65_1206 [Crocinitomicaceae bacterium]|jgi:hypothetical protein|nr:hypothetical protein [Crocinitomicaceae bacterium]